MFRQLNTIEKFLDEQFSFLKAYSTSDTFPKYNLISLSEHEDKIELALAGYKKEDLKVTLIDQLLQIECKKAHNANPFEFKEFPKFREMQIAQRDFLISFKIFKNSKVSKVKFADGILTINVDRPKPEVKESTSFNID